jgi:hypothetical protein
METLNNQWLSISDYSSEYQISISTLRRRIKANQIPYKMIGGKYYLSLDSSEPVSPVINKYDSGQGKKQTEPAPRSQGSEVFSQRELVDELKRVYMSSLHDKEEQILTLKQQVSDLKTLVMFLEKEITRLKTEF